MKNPTIIAGLSLSLLCLNFKDMPKIQPIVGIYKITSPSNKVYIGQSFNIVKRWKQYRSRSLKGQKKLINSFSKYSVASHIFEIIHQLPEDIEKSVMDNYELLYCDLYKSCGIELLNLREGFNGGRMSDEAKQNLSAFWKGKNKGMKFPDYVSKMNSDRLKITNIGNKYGKKLIGTSWGRHTEESKSKMSKALSLGRWHIYRNDILIGIFRDSIQASKSIGIPASTLRWIRRGKRKTNVNAKYLDIKIKIIPC